MSLIVSRNVSSNYNFTNYCLFAKKARRILYQRLHRSLFTLSAWLFRSGAFLMSTVWSMLSMHFSIYYMYDGECCTISTAFSFRFVAALYFFVSCAYCNLLQHRWCIFFVLFSVLVCDTRLNWNWCSVYIVLCWRTFFPARCVCVFPSNTSTVGARWIERMREYGEKVEWFEYGKKTPAK